MLASGSPTLRSAAGAQSAAPERTLLSFLAAHKVVQSFSARGFSQMRGRSRAGAAAARTARGPEPGGESHCLQPRGWQPQPAPSVKHSKAVTPHPGGKTLHLNQRAFGRPVLHPEPYRSSTVPGQVETEGRDGRAEELEAKKSAATEQYRRKKKKDSARETRGSSEGSSGAAAAASPGAVPRSESLLAPSRPPSPRDVAVSRSPRPRAPQSLHAHSRGGRTYLPAERWCPTPTTSARRRRASSTR